MLFILAASASEAYAYCARAKIPTRGRRIILRRGQLVGTRTATIHALPSFATCPQRHSIMAGLKWMKVEWNDVEMPPEPVVDQGDGMGPQMVLPPFTAGDVLPELDDDSLDKFREVLKTSATEVAEAAGIDPALLVDQGEYEPGAESLEDVAPEVQDRYGITDTEEPDGEQTGTPEPSEDAAPTPRAKRRSRCKACGELKDLDGHDCPMDPAVAAEPAATGPAESADLPVTGDPFAPAPSDGYF